MAAEPGVLTCHLNSGVTPCVSSHVWVVCNLGREKKLKSNSPFTFLTLSQLERLWFPGWDPAEQYCHGIYFSFSTINRRFAAIHGGEGEILSAQCPKPCPRHQPCLLKQSVGPEPLKHAGVRGKAVLPWGYGNSCSDHHKIPAGRRSRGRGLD